MRLARHDRVEAGIAETAAGNALHNVERVAQRGTLDRRLWICWLVAAEGALAVCLWRSWTLDEPHATAYGSLRSLLRTDAYGPWLAWNSVIAIRDNDVPGAWPAAALLATFVVGPVWLILAATQLRLWMRGRRWPDAVARSPRRTVTTAVVILCLSTAGAAVEALRHMGAHAGGAFVATPVVLVAGALVLVARHLPDPPSRSRAVLVTTVAVALTASGTLAFARWYTTDRLIVSTTAAGAVPVDGPAPAQPGALGWRAGTVNRPQNAVQVSGYTVIADNSQTDRTGEVVVRDSSTGRSQWRYARRDARVDLAGVTATRPHVLVVQITNLAGQVGLLGFELTTGDRLWSSPLGRQPEPFPNVQPGSRPGRRRSPTGRQDEQPAPR
jgi:hypothetical protein